MADVNQDPADELIDGYSDAVVDGDYVADFREGTNSARYMTPEQIKVLADLQRDREAATRPVFMRVID